MLPQFGFIVAQAGADYYSSLPPPPPPLPTTNLSNATQPPALAPLLNTLRSGTAHSSSVLTNYPSPPPPSVYSRQPSPSSQPPAQSFYSKEDIYPSALPNLMSQQEKRKDWIHPKSSHSALFYDSAIKQQEGSFMNTQTSRQDYADLMTFLDHEFWEQTDELYQEKLLALQHELLLLQKGTHTVFEQLVADYEIQREKSIQQAECFMKYQIAFVEQYFDQDLNALEDEYEAERKHLQETLITSIEDKRKQIKEDRYDAHEDEEVVVVTNEPAQKNRTKRTLRKRAADHSNTLRNEPLSKRRQVRPSTLHNIHTISPLEDEELENEFLHMKKLATHSSVTTHKPLSRLT